jgi:predicted nucleic acid-binding protein
VTRRVFVDSDIILDLLLAREPFFGAATRLFQLFQERRAEGWTSPVVFANLFYILRQAMPGAQAVAALRKLRLLLQVASMDEQVVDRALASSFADFEDALQSCAASAAELEILVTRNKRDYKNSGLLILDAAECVRLIEDKNPP